MNRSTKPEEGRLSERQKPDENLDATPRVLLSPSRLVRPEIIPYPRRKRSIGTLSFAALWFSMAAQMGIFTLGASLAETMRIPEALLAVVVANLGMVVVLVLIGDIGIEHGLNFAGYLRVPFGTVGNYLPLALRGLTAVAWFGIQTYFAAAAMDVVAIHFFGFSAFAVWYILLGLLQILIVAAGLGVIQQVVNFAAPALAALSIWLLYLMFSKGSLAQFWSSTPQAERQPFVVAIVANLSFWTTVALNLPDFTRSVLAGHHPGRFFSRNRVSIVAQLIGVPLGMLFFVGVGMAGFIFTGEPNPVLAIAELVGGGFYLVLALTVVLLAQVSTNITANLFAAAYVANALGAPRIGYRLGAVIAGVIGLLTFPWLLLDVFLTFLPLIGAALAPVAGVMIADHYLIRRRRIDVPQIFDGNGQYRYWRGVNPAAFLAWVVGAALGVLFLDYSFLVALPVSLLAHYLLMRFWIVRQYRQPEVDEPDSRFLATSVGRDWSIGIRGDGPAQQGR